MRLCNSLDRKEEDDGRRFEEKTVRKALQRGYVDAQRLLASPSQMQKFLLRLEEKEGGGAHRRRTAGSCARCWSVSYAGIWMGNTLPSPPLPWPRWSAHCSTLYRPGISTRTVSPAKAMPMTPAVLDCCWKLCQPELEAYLAWEREQLVCRNGSAGA